MQMDMSQYFDMFLDESKEHIAGLNQKLLELERNSQDVGALNEIFRVAHTLKGMSSTMGFDDLADLTHHMENVLSDLKEGALQVTSSVVDILFQCFDRIQLILERIENKDFSAYDNQDLLSVLDNVKSGKSEAAAIAEPQTEIGGQDHLVHEGDEILDFNEYDFSTLKDAVDNNLMVFHLQIEVDPATLMKAVRVFMVFKALEDDCEIIKSIPSKQNLEEGKFENIFDLLVTTALAADELNERLSHISEVNIIMIKALDVQNIVSSRHEIGNGKSSAPAASEPAVVNDSKGSAATMAAHKVKQTVRVDIERLDSLMNLVGELVMHKGRLEQIAMMRKIGELNDTLEQIDRVSTDLQSVVMKVRMVPIEQVFNRFPRMVRDLARDLNKDVEFMMEGKETELDRTVIDEIGDPLIHLLRNSLDHGLELPQERIAKGKPAKGMIMLRARHEGNNVYIEVEDDGAGLNLSKIKAKAVEKGVVSEREAEDMSKEQAIELLFAPGFSTAATVTDVSGRGVGLDVVKSKIENLNGEIQVDTKPEAGTKFKIKLPLTLAIIQALMVSVADEIYAIPLSNVDETTMINSEGIKLVQGQEVIMLRGNVLPLFRLSVILNVPKSNEADNDEMYVVVVRKGEKQIGLVVDTLIGQQEIVIKSLGKVLGGIPGIAGAIVAGDGNVRLILDVATLF